MKNKKNNKKLDEIKDEEFYEEEIEKDDIDIIITESNDSKELPF